MKKFTLCLISVAIGLFLIFSTIPVLAKSYTVAILSSGDSPTYTRIIETIKKTATQNNPDSISFNIFYSKKLSPEVHAKISKANLLLTIGQRAMLAASQHKKYPPILASLIPRQSFMQNLPALQASNNKVAGVYIDSPPQQQILLAKILLGNLKTIGILLSENASPNEKQLSTILKKLGINSRIEKISSSDNIIRKLTRVINKSDALLALPDPLIFNRNTARNILLATYRQRIPVIGFSANYVKAGALAAVFPTPEQVAKQTGELVMKILTSETFPYGGEYTNDFDVSINPNVSRSLGITTATNKQIKKTLQKLLGKYK